MTSAGKTMKTQMVALGVAVLGLGGLAFAMFQNPQWGYTNLLVCAFFFVTLAAGGLVLLALNTVAKAGWHIVLKRVFENYASLLPVGALLILLTLVNLLSGENSIYEWARPGVMEHDHLLHEKAAYLNSPFYVIRMVVVLVLWLLFSLRLRGLSGAQDKDGLVERTNQAVRWSTGFLVCFALTFSMASFDWIMGLEAHWFSTVFGMYNIAGLLSSSVAAVVLTCVLLHKTGWFPEFRIPHLHDLAKLLFAFCTFWAYLWFCQFMLIWYGNLPEEGIYYIRRWHEGWQPLFYLNFALNWLLPFFLLLPRPLKRSPNYVAAIALVVLLGRWLDIYLMVVPANFVLPPIGWVELSAVLGFAGLFVFLLQRRFQKVPLIAKKDPYLQESLNLH
ncbi:MAG: hypothetical protein FWC28_07440 [Proteobacteria bacterium]|nr:hypothetical protein [Cystobacterineae bacterium]MCL2315064.1 hypothetical protein [Pseudomonadota bacterium]